MTDETAIVQQNNVAVKQDEPEKAAKLSIQARAEPQQVVDSAPAIWWFTTAAEGEIAEWWSEKRDKDLREFVKLPGNDILAGAVSSMVKKFRAMSWVIEGPQRVVKKYQTMLSEAEFGKGWGSLLAKTIQDYLCADKGAFWELIGDGKPDGPLTGPVIGVAHLDSAQCALTGDLEFPVLFRDPKNGKTHKLHATRVVHMVDQESPEQSRNGIGFCAVSRVIAASQVLLKLAQYKNEKLSDLPEAGLLIMSNIPKHQYDDARANYQRERRKLGEELWAPIMTLFSLDPTQKATAEFVSFASLPDAFNERDATDIYVNVMALAFGVDTREFWPMSAGPLGTAAETLVQHQKAQGKGIGDMISTIERAVNWAILPASVHFRFDFQDDQEDAERAQIISTKATTIMGMWTNGQDPLGGDPVVSRDEVRQMLADEVPYFNEEWLNPLEEDEEEEATDTEQEEKWYRDEWGPVIALDSKGFKVRSKAAPPRKKPWMREPDVKGGPGSGYFGHAGRPGIVGGSAPTGLSYAQHNGPKSQTIDLPDSDYADYEQAIRMDSQEARDMLKRAGVTREEALRRIDEARGIVDSTPQTRSRYIDENGNYTPERQALHDQIEDELLAGATPQENPLLFLTGGLPGAGKSHMLKEPQYADKKRGLVLIDSDNIKERLAQADKIGNLGARAASYHAEADDIIASVFERAISSRLNIGLDGTMKNAAKMEALVDRFKGNGYRVEVAFADLSTRKAMTRAIGRYLEGGRFVDPLYIASHNHKNVKTLYRLRSKVDVWRHWSTDVPFGERAKLIDEVIR